MKSHTNFVEVLNTAIEDTLSGILGETKSEIYYQLKSYNIDSKKLGEDPEALEKAMTHLFKAGWHIFKRAILRSFCQRLNLSMDKFANHTFAECISIAEMEFFVNNKGKGAINYDNNQNSSTHDALKLALPQIDLTATSKNCKVCGNVIDGKNNEQLLAELCDDCWDLQNSVWDSPAVEACVSTERKSTKGDS